MMRQGGATPESRVSFAFRKVLSRKPTTQEISILTKGLQQRIARFRGDLDGARALVKVGQSPVDYGLDIAELAAYTVTASTLLNSDEAVTKE
jgi:hypothetical protein